MSDTTVVVTGGSDDEPSTSEVVEAIETVLDKTIEAITDESQHDSNVDFLAGAAVATAQALSEQVAELTDDVETVQATADVALDAAVDATVAVEEIQAEQAAAEIVDEITEPVMVEPDEPPPTLRSRMSKFWFGDQSL